MSQPGKAQIDVVPGEPHGRALHRDPGGELVLGGLGLMQALTQADCSTPAYAYDIGGMVDALGRLQGAFDGARHMVAYAVKANSGGPILKAFAQAGCGADVVSGAELRLAVACGIAPERIVYSGVGKRDDELDVAIGVGSRGIFAINAESVEELPRIAARARALGRVARVSLRLNPGLDASTLATHSYISTGHDEAKFGIAIGDVPAAIDCLHSTQDCMALVGVTAHAGSQLTATEGYLASANVVFDAARSLRATHPIEFVDTGGGFGIDYGHGGGCSVTPEDFIRQVRARQREAGLGDLTLVCEPGRALVASWGVLVARVLAHKSSRAIDNTGNVRELRWLVIDAGMNDLMRPALYQAYHRVIPVARASDSPLSTVRVVGPVCESSDDFGLHDLPFEPGGLVALLDAGAYGFSMASRYNGRELPAEIFVQDARILAVHQACTSDDWVQSRLLGERGAHVLVR